MAGVLNKKARRYNISEIHNGKRIVVRLSPGINFVDDEHWDAVKDKDYCQLLKENDVIEWGKTAIDSDSESKDANVAQTKELNVNDKGEVGVNKPTEDTTPAKAGRKSRRNKNQQK